MTYGNETPGENLLYGIEGQGIAESHRLELEPLEPVLLVLTGDMGEPAVILNFRHEGGENSLKRISEPPIEKVWSQGINCMTVRAAQTFDP